MKKNPFEKHDCFFIGYMSYVVGEKVGGHVPLVDGEVVVEGDLLVGEVPQVVAEGASVGGDSETNEQVASADGDAFLDHLRSLYGLEQVALYRDLAIDGYFKRDMPTNLLQTTH